MRAFNIEFDVEKEIEKYRELAEEIRPYVCETVSYLHEILSSGKKVLVEGANASMLDIGKISFPKNCVKNDKSQYSFYN